MRYLHRLAGYRRLNWIRQWEWLAEQCSQLQSFVTELRLPWREHRPLVGVFQLQLENRLPRG